jgi:hypothetical protein
MNLGGVAVISTKMSTELSIAVPRILRFAFGFMADTTRREWQGLLGTRFHLPEKV